MSELAFHEVRIGKAMRPSIIPGALPVADGPAVSVSPATANPFSDMSLSIELRRALWQQRDWILGAMPVVGGVLLHVAFHEAKTRDEDRPAVQRLVSLDLLGVGRVPRLVVVSTMATPRSSRRAPRGWSSKSIYLWATRG